MDCDPQKQLVIEFSAAKKQVIDYDTEFKDQVEFLEFRYLTQAVLGVQKILRKLFFGVAQADASSIQDEQKHEFLIKLIEELQSSSECTLNTFFRVVDLDGDEDDSPFEI